MRTDHSCVDVWRLVLEARSPLSIASGKAELVDDVVLALTPAGLPYIPGTALAGVLRHALQAHVQDELGVNRAKEEVADVFGYAQSDNGRASRFECTHAHIHDSHDRVVSDVLAEVSPNEPILGPLVHRLPTKRQRVRINAHGAAADTGHFDRTVVPAGHRFSVELRLWSVNAQAAETARNWLEGLLSSPALSVGGLTRSGLGRLKVVRGVYRRLDLRNARELGVFLDRPAALDQTRGLHPWKAAIAKSPWATLPLDLRAEGALRVGQGNHPLSQHGQKIKAADDMPYVEPCVVWESPPKGQLTQRVVIPATAIKGAVAHRLAFHDRRHRGEWATPDSVRTALAEHAPKPTGVAAWLGTIKGEQGASYAGGLMFEDITLPLPSVPSRQVGHRTHNSIDRFTGSVRDGLLFTEEYLFRVPLPTELHLSQAARRRADAPAWQALRDTLEDLVQGRLAIGADSASGLGYLEGDYSREKLEALRQAALQACGSPADATAQEMIHE